VRAQRAMVAIVGWVLASVAIPAPAAAEAARLPAVLRLEDALRLLQDRGFDLLIAEALAEGAAGDVRAAGAIPNPNLSASYGRSFTHGRCVDEAGNPAPCGLLPEAQYGVGISDQGAVFDLVSGKRGLRLSTARAALAAARASREDARRTLEAQVKQAFLQVVVSKEALRFAREVAAASGRTADLTRARYEEGAISEADLARVEVAKLESDQAADSAAQTLRGAKVGLAFLLGVRGVVGDYDVEAPELLHTDAPRALAGATPDSLFARAREKRPDLAAAQGQRERAEAALALARRQRFPEIALSLNYSQQGTTNSAVTPPTLTAGVSLPLPLFYQQQGEVQKAEADVRAQSVQAAKVEAQVASDIETGLADYDAAAQLARRMEGVLLERARRARDLVAIQFQKGAASLLEFLDAQRTFIATSGEYLQDLSLYWRAVFKLEQAVGEDLR
jgi:cobalt-zinc-cadmium efflux system outer membrane protein